MFHSHQSTFNSHQCTYINNNDKTLIHTQNLSRSLFPIQSSEERLESGGWGTELGKVLIIGDTGERQLEGSDICTCVGGIGGHLLSAPIVGGGGVTRT